MIVRARSDKVEASRPIGAKEAARPVGVCEFAVGADEGVGVGGDEGVEDGTLGGKLQKFCWFEVPQLFWNS